MADVHEVLEATDKYTNPSFSGR